MCPRPQVLLVALGAAVSILPMAQAQSRRPGVVSQYPEVPQPPESDRDDDWWGGGDATRGDSFRYYSSITDPGGQSRHWAEELVFDTEVLSRDFAILYEGSLGHYPEAGPHIAMRAGYLDAHLAKIADDLDMRIPDRDFAGLAVIDYETFRAEWDRTPNVASNQSADAADKDFRDDWREYIRSVNPQFDRMSEPEQEAHLRDTYEAAVRDFYLATLARCRELRPNARWGFYGYPYRFFKHRREAPTDLVSYGDGTHPGSLRNDRIQWMWDAVDFISPSVYPLMAVPGDGNGCRDDDECTAEQDMLYVQNMIQEAERVSGGKPVLPFVGTKYYRTASCWYYRDVTDANLYSQIVGPSLAGADGAILWGHVNNAGEQREWQELLETRVLPLMASVVQDGDGGSGDGGDGGGYGGFNPSSTGDENRGGPKGTRPRLAASGSGPSSVSGKKPPMEFRRATDRISKPALTAGEVAEARRRAKVRRDER